MGERTCDRLRLKPRTSAINHDQQQRILFIHAFHHCNRTGCINRQQRQTGDGRHCRCLINVASPSATMGNVLRIFLGPAPTANTHRTMLSFSFLSCSRACTIISGSLGDRVSKRMKSIGRSKQPLSTILIQ